MEITNAENVGISKARLKHVTDLTSSYVEKGKLAGTVSLVARRGQIVHLECKGKMSLESGEPMREDTIFRIYSMAKPVTSVAAMILLERGHFQLDTPITKFLPEFKDMEVFVSGTSDNFKTTKATRDINFADLLTHTAGFTYPFMEISPVNKLYRDHELNNFGNDQTMGEFVKDLSKLPLLYSPGTKWSYSFATDVLGYLVEIISGKTLDAFFKDEIFEPLGMVDTDFYVPQNKLSRFATLYINKNVVPQSKRNEFPDKTLLIYDSNDYGLFDTLPLKKSGGAGLVSTVKDYYKFCTMLLRKGHTGNDALLSPKTVELMMSNFLPTDIVSYSASANEAFIPPGFGFGLGGSLLLDPAKARMLGTVGEYAWSGAAHTSFFIDPKEELIGIFLTQVFPFGYYNVVNQFNQLVYQSLID